MAFYFLSLEKAKKILVEAHKFDPDDLVIGMMGDGQDWNDGHLYLLYNKYGDDNFND